MLVAVFHRFTDGVPWQFVATYNGNTLDDAVNALVSHEGQALAFDLSTGTTFRISQVLRCVGSTTVSVDDVPRPHVEQPAPDDPPTPAELAPAPLVAPDPPTGLSSPTVVA